MRTDRPERASQPRIIIKGMISLYNHPRSVFHSFIGVPQLQLYNFLLVEAFPVSGKKSGQKAKHPDFGARVYIPRPTRGVDWMDINRHSEPQRFELPGFSQRFSTEQRTIL